MFWSTVLHAVQCPNLLQIFYTTQSNGIYEIVTSVEKRCFFSDSHVCYETSLTPRHLLHMTAANSPRCTEALFPCCGSSCDSLRAGHQCWVFCKGPYTFSVYNAEWINGLCGAFLQARGYVHAHFLQNGWQWDNHRMWRALLFFVSCCRRENGIIICTFSACSRIGAGDTYLKNESF